ncbi:unnamed protein product [Schistosoma margrebowiei]|uniref:J domain-containing protein n=2 Tax=Schistosoma margrebowiei TaxID=48269 RepID=A0AA85AEG2_9TREM|nr:unnamed protein product [Schistosoma margrebowiei]
MPIIVKYTVFNNEKDETFVFYTCNLAEHATNFERSTKFLIILILSLTPQSTYAQIDGIYCGEETCYDVLQVTRDDDKNRIRKAYHEMARKHHPDRQKTSEDKIKAEERFRLINTAYEILSDPEQRTEYDYMLDNPDQMYYHYYRYYRRRVSTKVDVRLVIISILLIISSIQYAGQWTSYNHALSYLLKDPKHRAKAKQIAIADGRLNISKYEVGRRLTRDELKEREEQLLRDILKETVELRGDCCRPSLKRVLLVRILFFPWTCYIWLRWMLYWVVKYWILRREYDEEARIFITRRRLKISENEWDYAGEEQQAKYLSQKLWINENYQKFLADQQEANRIRAAEDTDLKRYRRYTKRAGPASVNLEDLF